jgi:hypothetical protein
LYFKVEHHYQSSSLHATLNHLNISERNRQEQKRFVKEECDIS